jgi:hypothetical protein
MGKSQETQQLAVGRNGRREFGGGSPHFGFFRRMYSIRKMPRSLLRGSSLTGLMDAFPGVPTNELRKACVSRVTTLYAGGKKAKLIKGRKRVLFCVYLVCLIPPETKGSDSLHNPFGLTLFVRSALSFRHRDNQFTKRKVTPQPLHIMKIEAMYA